ncbi:MAG TPA: hypothetical protein VFT32_11440 [Candidatus Eisenbacteria bacterium]|nr:hypothetical protein [Candidatus Eisenbacteria bacterium]
MNLSLDLTPNWIALACVAAAAAVAAWAYLTRYEALTRGRRRVLLGARLLVLAGLLVAAFAPVLSVPVPGTARNRLLVLVDHSGSMDVRDASGGRTRREAADSAAAAIAGALGERYDVRTAAFGARLGPFARGGAPPEAARAVGGGETAIGDAVRAALERNDPDSVAAILVVSDGIVNRGEDPERALAGAVPAYALWAGVTSDPPSVSLSGVEVPAEAVAGRPAPVTVSLRQGNRPAGEGTVRLLEGGVERARARFTLNGPGATTRVSLPYTPSSAGVHFLNVVVDSVAGDPLRENKRRLVAVHARASSRRLVVLAGRSDWDLRALVRGATEDTTWSAVRAAPAGGGDVLVGGAARSFAQVIEGASAVVVRYDGRSMSAERSAALMRYVERGGGVLLWIEPGGAPPSDPAWQRALGLVWRNWADPPGVTASVELAPGGRTHEVALLGGDAASASAAWSALPPIAPTIMLGHGPALTPILFARIGDERIPLLLAGRLGEGRVAVLNGSGTYRWGLTAAGLTAGGVEGAFFGGLCRWLEAAGEGRPVRIEAPDVSAEGAGVPVRVVTPAGEAGAAARLVARPESGGPSSESKLDASGDGAFTGTLALPPGIHRVTALLERGGRVVARDSARVAVGAGGLEFEALAAEPATLSRLAEGSGGAVAPLEEPGAVVERLRRPESSRARLAEIDLFHNPYLFALLIAGLTIEWALRKRYHLL